MGYSGQTTLSARRPGTVAGERGVGLDEITGGTSRHHVVELVGRQRERRFGRGDQRRRAAGAKGDGTGKQNRATFEVC